MLEQLLSRRLLVVVGKGGVGKSTFCAALARRTASLKGQTLAIECDPRAPLASLLGASPTYTPQAAGPNLSVMALDGGHALAEYLRLVVPGQAILAAISASKLYQYFVAAAPGLKELMMLGKIYYEVKIPHRRVPVWQTVVFDAPSSGHALSLLRMPFAAQNTFGESLVGREAHNIAAMLTDPGLCGLIQVTTAEPLALAETLETNQELRRLALPVLAVVLNRYQPAHFTAADVAWLRRTPSMRAQPEIAAYVAALARARIAHTQEADRAFRTLKAKADCPIVTLPELNHLSGEGLVAGLVSALSSDLKPLDASA